MAEWLNHITDPSSRTTFSTDRRERMSGSHLFWRKLFYVWVSMRDRLSPSVSVVISHTHTQFAKLYLYFRPIFCLSSFTSCNNSVQIMTSQTVSCSEPRTSSLHLVKQVMRKFSCFDLMDHDHASSLLLLSPWPSLVNWISIKEDAGMHWRQMWDYSALYGSYKGTAHWLPVKNEESLACRGLSSFLFDVLGNISQHRIQEEVLAHPGLPYNFHLI